MSKSVTSSDWYESFENDCFSMCMCTCSSIFLIQYYDFFFTIVCECLFINYNVWMYMEILWNECQ